MSAAIENEEWERALEASEGIFFAKLFPQQKREVFSHLCRVIGSGSEVTRIAATEKCRRLLPDFSDRGAEAWAQSLLSSTLAKIPDEPETIEAEPPTDQPIEDAFDEPIPVSASDIEGIRRRRDFLQNLLETPDALKALSVPFGVGEELVEHSDRVWLLSEAYEGVRLCIVAPEGNYMAQGLRELPLGEPISILRLEDSWLLPVPADPEGQAETLQQAVASMTELLEEIVRSGNPILCGSCGGELPPISKFCLHCGAAV